MKSLKNYIKEGLLDMEDVDKTFKEKIRQFLKEIYKGASKFKISRTPGSDGKFIVNVNGDVYIKNNRQMDVISLTNEYFRFGVVEGDFNCQSCYKLISLEGAPEEVGGNFNCNFCQITSLKGAPKKVGKSFFCTITTIKTFEGSPEEIGEDFVCHGCSDLTTLKGAPEKIGGSFDCGHTSITSLKYSPKKVNGKFSCYSCGSLTSLEGAPKEVGGSFTCGFCKKLKSLKGAPETVGEDFVCHSCPELTSLEGAPKEVGGDFVYDREFSETDIPSTTKIKGKTCYFSV